MLIKNIYHNRLLLLTLAKRDLLSSYNGALLGNIWAIVDPLTYVVLSLVFFQYAMKPSLNDVPYILNTLPLIVLWTFCSVVLNTSTGLVKEYSFLLRHNTFDARCISVVRVVAQLYVHLFLMIFIIMFLGYKFDPISPSKFFVTMYFTICTCALLFSFSLIFSAVGAFISDTKNIVSLLTQAGFWISPIFWEPNIFPAPIAIIMYANPLYYPLHGYRWAFVDGTGWFNFELQTLYFWGIVFIAYYFGKFLYEKLSCDFGDVV